MPCVVGIVEFASYAMSARSIILYLEGRMQPPHAQQLGEARPFQPCRTKPISSKSETRPPLFTVSAMEAVMVVCSANRSRKG